MAESASKEPGESSVAQDVQPAEVPEGADPGTPTMDYFEKGEEPPEEKR